MGFLRDEKGRQFEVELQWDDEQQDYQWVLYNEDDSPMVWNPDTGLPYTSLFEVETGNEVEIEIDPAYLIPDFSRVSTPVSGRLREQTFTDQVAPLPTASKAKTTPKVATPEDSEPSFGRGPASPQGANNPLAVTPPVAESPSRKPSPKASGISAVKPGGGGPLSFGQVASKGDDDDLLEVAGELQNYLRAMSLDDEYEDLVAVLQERPLLLLLLANLVGRARISDETLEREPGALATLQSHVTKLRRDVAQVVSRSAPGTAINSVYATPGLQARLMQAVDELRVLREGFELAPSTARTEVGNPQVLGFVTAMALWYFQPLPQEGGAVRRSATARPPGSASEFLDRTLGRQGAGYVACSLDIVVQGKQSQIFFLSPTTGQRGQVHIPSRREEIESRMVQGLVDAVQVFDPSDRRVTTLSDTTGYGPWVLSRRMIRQRANTANLMPDREHMYFLEPAWLAEWCGLNNPVMKRRTVARVDSAATPHRPSFGPVGPLDQGRSPVAAGVGTPAPTRPRR